MNRSLVCEFPPLILEANNQVDQGYQQTNNLVTDYRPITSTLWVNESKLDLSGYALDDLTVYFRNSFEQTGGHFFGRWEVPDPNRFEMTTYKTALEEYIILTSVPMSDENIQAIPFNTPGFTGFNVSLIPGLNPGTFDRTHIIHGQQKTLSIKENIASSPLNPASSQISPQNSGFYTIFNYSDFSSLEPTAADCIYCYRIFILPQSHREFTSGAGMIGLQMPSSRIILNSMIDKEADLEYMMRLKRSYELANQV